MTEKTVIDVPLVDRGNRFVPIGDIPLQTSPIKVPDISAHHIHQECHDGP
jgi:hypothetical protein